MRQFLLALKNRGRRRARKKKGRKLESLRITFKIQIKVNTLSPGKHL